jgi:hypothetical protein
LDDDVINGHMMMLNSHNKIIYGDGPNIMSTYYFSSFFFDKLLKKDGTHESFLRKFNTHDYGRLIFPVNLSNSHWIYIRADTNNHSTSCYDPLRGEYPSEINTLINWLELELPNSRSQWSTSYLTDLPRQKNGHDCGVYLLLYAHHQTFNREGTFGPINQNLLNRSREIFGCDILRGKLGEYNQADPQDVHTVNVGDKVPEKPTYRNVVVSHQAGVTNVNHPRKFGPSPSSSDDTKVEITQSMTQDRVNTNLSLNSDISTGDPSESEAEDIPPVGNSANITPSQPSPEAELRNGNLYRHDGPCPICPASSKQSFTCVQTLNQHLRSFHQGVRASEINKIIRHRVYSNCPKCGLLFSKKIETTSVSVQG